MTTPSLHEELDRLDRKYQRVCEAFATGRISPAEARDKVLSLSYTDTLGGTWRIDTRRSGRHAAFLHEMANIVGDGDQNPHLVLHRALDRLDRKYQQIHEEFVAGRIAAPDARALVEELSHTDSLGRVWRVDMQRSGRHASFFHEIGKRRISSNQTIHESLHRDLHLLDEEYRKICNSFELGVIDADEARRQVAALRHTDSLGRTWRIDPRRSGRHAAFEQVKPSSDPTAPFDVTAVPTTIYDDDLTSDALMRPRIDPTVLTTGPVPRTTGPVPRTTGPVPRAAANGSRNTGQIDRTTGTIATVESEIDELGDPLARQMSDQTYTPRLRQPTSSPRTRRNESRGVAVSRLTAGVVLVVAAAAALAMVSNIDSEAQPASSTVPGSVPVDANASTTTAPAAVEPTAKLSDFANRAAVPLETDIEFGRSVLDKPLTVYRRGINGAPRVLVIGTIHGDEPAGLDVVALMRTMSMNIDVDLWLVPSMNPDGTVAATRQNANKVDMNRNFPQNWKSLGTVGYWQYSGPSPGSEPEVRAMMELGKLVNPHLVIWYHQDYFRISPSDGREGRIRTRYAELVDLPLLPISGGNYGGTGAMWANTILARNGAGITVEFGPSLREGEAQRNADAVLTIVREFFT